MTRTYSVAEIEVACRAIEVLIAAFGAPAKEFGSVEIARRIIRDGLAEIEAEHERGRDG